MDGACIGVNAAIWTSLEGKLKILPVAKTEHSVI